MIKPFKTNVKYMFGNFAKSLQITTINLEIVRLNIDFVKVKSFCMYVYTLII